MKKLFLCILLLLPLTGISGQTSETQIRHSYANEQARILTFLRPGESNNEFMIAIGRYEIGFREIPRVSNMTAVKKWISLPELLMKTFNSLIK